MLLLVRHSAPAIDPARPAEEWRLSAEGRARCGPLAAELAGELRLEVRETDALRETARRTVPWLEAKEFRQAIRALFERPDEVVFGEESAAQALARFSAGLDGLGDRTAVVSHDTVISLYAAAHGEREAFELWSSLQLPDLVVV